MKHATAINRTVIGSDIIVSRHLPNATNTIARKQKLITIVFTDFGILILPNGKEIIIGTSMNKSTYFNIVRGSTEPPVNKATVTGVNIMATI